MKLRTSCLLLVIYLHVLSFNNFLDSEKSGRKDRREKMFHIDDNVSGTERDNSLTDVRMGEKTSDPICGVTATDKTLIVARESGSVHRYALPSVALVNKYQLETRPHHLSVNCNTTLLSIIDVTGLLQFVDLGGNFSFTQIAISNFLPL